MNIPLLGEPNSFSSSSYFRSRILSFLLFLSVFTVVIALIFINNNFEISYNNMKYEANWALRTYNEMSNTSLILDHVVSAKLLKKSFDMILILVAYDKNEAPPGRTYKVDMSLVWNGLSVPPSVYVRSFKQSCFYFLFC